MGLDIYFYKQNKMNPEREEVLKNFKEADEALSDFWMRHPDFNLAAHGGSIGKEHDELEKTYKVCKSVYNTLMGREEVAYFRKVNLLLPFFGYGDNCSDLIITKDQVEDLIGTCSNVLDYFSNLHESNLFKEDYDKQEWIEYCQETLPNQDGFYFGDYEYGERYTSKVEHVKKIFEEVIESVDWERQDLVMYCWW